jgi:hypothetical protein
VRLLFNLPGDPVGELVARYRGLLETLAAGAAPAWSDVRAVVGAEFTRGHFARAV